MKRYTLYSYKNVAEYNKHLENLGGSQLVTHYSFEHTREVLEDSPDVQIEISGLVELVKGAPANITPALYNFDFATDKTRFLIKEELAEDALTIFNTVFDNVEALYNIDEELFIDDSSRKIIYTYNGANEYSNLLEWCESHDIPIISINNGYEIKRINYFALNPKFLVNISTAVKASINNPQIGLLLNQFVRTYPEANYIVEADLAKECLDYHYALFESQEKVKVLLGNDYPETILNGVDKSNSSKRLVTNLNKAQLDALFDNFNNKLIGHSNFKEYLKNNIYSFTKQNKIGRKKVFSIFLCGHSGLGKTEVGRQLSKLLDPKSGYSKINFGNYSSKDTLNSLIGSPRGYVGSEEGELSNKIEKNTAGVIICDEFEKADTPIFNFFLELLEEGHFTDSLSREFELNGYIVIFTSNIKKSEITQKFPAEFISRLDLIAEFEPLDELTKQAYIAFQVDEILNGLKNKGIEIPFSDKQILAYKSMKLDNLNDLRKIKRIVENTIFNEIQL